jgi:hypothetical protein
MLRRKSYEPRHKLNSPPPLPIGKEILETLRTALSIPSIDYWTSQSGVTQPFPPTNTKESE